MRLNMKPSEVWLHGLRDMLRTQTGTGKETKYKWNVILNAVFVYPHDMPCNHRHHQHHPKMRWVFSFIIIHMIHIYTPEFVCMGFLVAFIYILFTFLSLCLFQNYSFIFPTHAFHSSTASHTVQHRQSCS